MDISNLLMQEIEVRLLRLKIRCEQARMIVISDQFKIQKPPRSTYQGRRCPYPP